MILVDTSVWIDHLRSGDERLADLLNRSQVVIHPFVIGELACGNLRNRDEVLRLLNDLPQAVNANVINLRPNSLFCRKISSIHHHLKESEMNSVPAVPTTDQAVLPKII